MDVITKIIELKKLLDDGLLTLEEFNRYKSELIAGNSEIKKSETKINEKIPAENISSAGNTIAQKVNFTNNKAEDINAKNRYVKDLNHSQTNHSYGRYILVISLFLVFIGFTSYNLYFKEKWAKEERNNNGNESVKFTYLTEPVDKLESRSVTGLSNEKELYSYLDDVAVYWSSEWVKAKQFQNENKRFEEMLKVDRCINAYPLGFTEGLIMLNDLPMELSEKAREHFQSKLKELGFDPNWENDSNQKNLGDINNEIQSYETDRSVNENENQSDDGRFSKILSLYNAEKIKYNGIDYLFFPNSMSFTNVQKILSDDMLYDSENSVIYRLPTYDEMKSLFTRNSEVGTGYYTNGRYFKAKMAQEFSGIDEAVWFWLNVKSGQSCINMFNGANVDFQKYSTSFPVHTLLIGDLGC
jgi:hypothetical protein